MPLIRAYLQLLRLPAVFTAMADIFLGWLLTHADLTPVATFLWLLAASACLYLAGMVLNDLFDRRIDAIERPTRPIPSGRVGLRGAIQLGTILLLGGIVLAGVVGWPSLWIAVGLAACILAYDGLLKGTPLGPVAMGGCRFLNVMLGASGLPTATAVWALPQLAVAAALGVYIAGVTWFARNEAVQSGRWQLTAAQGVVNLGLAGLVAWMLSLPSAGRDRLGPLVMLLVVLLILNRRMAAAVFDPIPARVQPTIRSLLLSLVVIDATLVFFVTNNPAPAVLVLALLIPATFLGRWISMT